ncbi:MAG: class I SAM-dependent methyltransferase [Nitrososphaera sp.]|nr:class I SAM-dependent methyltransferase [Nitrososphaera sp.]
MNPRRWPLGENKVMAIPRLDKLAELSSTEIDLLHYLASQPLLDNIANLGHSEGGSAITMAMAMRNTNPGKSVQSVDLFSDRTQFKRVRRNLVRYGVRDLVELRRGETIMWADKFRKRNNKFGGVFVDADHSYEGVRRDSEDWRRLLLVGGWIGFHDTNQDFSHKAIEDTIVKDSRFDEIKDLHIYSIRVFRRIEQ